MYGGTKEEMQRLLVDAEKLTGIHYDINKFNRTRELDTEKYEMCKKLGIKLLYFTNDTRDLPNEYIDKIYTNEDELISEIKRLIN